MRRYLLSLVLVLALATAGCTARAAATDASRPGQRPHPRPVWLQTLAMVSAKAGWAIAWSGDPNSSAPVYSRLLRTSDGGRAWVNVTPAGASELLHSLNSYPVLDVISADSAWLAVTRQHSDTESDLARTGVFETADAGRTWRASALIRAKGDVVALSVAGRKDGWLLRSLGSAAGQNVVGLDRSTDGGRRWEPVRTALPANCDKSGLTFATPATGFITSDCAAGTGAVLVSADGGRHWTQASLPYPALTPCQPSGCAATPPVFFGRTGYLTVGAYPGPGLLLTTHATGATWQVVKLPSGSDPYPRVDFFDARHGVLMPSQPQSRFGRVFYATSDGGLTWRPMRQASTIRAFSSVQFVTSAIGFAWNLNSQSPALYRTANGGETWSRFVPLS
jgi:photosystem II stability/assembly factor-like uncharacterized protein